MEELPGFKQEAAEQQMRFQVLTGSWKIWSQMMTGLPTLIEQPTFRHLYKQQ